MKKLISTALALILLLCALASCDTECEHEWGELEERVAPTCQAVGEGVQKCGICLAERTQELPLASHDWGGDGICTACGSKLYGDSSSGEKEEEEPYDYLGQDLSQFATIGAYRGLIIEIDPVRYLTEEEFEQQLDYEMIYMKKYTEKKEGTVKKTDIVSIKYEGYKDGVKFEGGTGESDFFTVFDGGGFIDGFAEGLIGAQIGQTTDVNVVFPENYHSAELAGQPAVFKVTVNFVYEADEITDELITELSGGEMTSAEEFIDMADKLMREDAEKAYESQKLPLLWERIIETSTVTSLPDEAVEQMYDQYIDYYTQYASRYGMTLEKFLESNSMTKDDLKTQAKADVLTDLLVYTVLKTEGITLTDEEYETELKEYADSYGMSGEEILNYYTKEQLTEMFTYTKAYESVLQWNRFKDKE